MLTGDGPRVLEYNVRFGDPETQAILVRLRSDLSEIFDAVARGGLGAVNVEWSEDASACVVLAARGYPERPETGARIEGLEEAARVPGVEIFHAGTARDRRRLARHRGRPRARRHRHRPGARRRALALLRLGLPRSTGTACTTAATSATGVESRQ